MLEDFLSYIRSNLSVIPEDKILLAISGGIDSMVMLHLFRQLDYTFSVAHINHSTRNGASNQDMEFVSEYCKQHSIPFYAKTLSYEVLNKGNFQENARKERFTFLHQLKEELGYQWIATAHHKDDRWETFLMNLNRKSGLQGLTSLRAKQNDVIHPLLGFTKGQIMHYQEMHTIAFVHDTSNDSDAYVRNTIRHKITPDIQKVFPGFIENINQSIVHLDDSHALLQEFISSAGLISEDQNSGHTIIDLIKVKAFKNQKTLLYHILGHFGFNYSTIRDILDSTTTGSRFFALEFEGLLDRGILIIRKKRTHHPSKLEINHPGEFDLEDGRKLMVSVGSPNQIPNHLWLNMDKVKWPLIIRSIEAGDKFSPHGMGGKTKSIKKLCTDMKVDAFTKEGMMIVERDSVILQVIGIRSSHESTTSDIKNALTFNITD